jgi:hypothetical protein
VIHRTTSREVGLAQLAHVEAEWNAWKERITAGASLGVARLSEGWVRYAREALAAFEPGTPLPPVRVDLGALRIGDAALATNLSELFCEIGLGIKRRSPFRWTAVGAYTDGMINYVPHRDAYAEGGYGVDWNCRVNPEGGELIEETCVSLLRSLA